MASSGNRTAPPTHAKTMFLAGLMSGVTTSVLLNPWDRALYLSFKEKRPFLRRENFHNPFCGVMGATVSKIVSQGMYFPLFDLFHGQYYTEDRPGLSKFLAGNSAGVINALLTSPISAIKYRMWGRPCQEGSAYLSTAQMMWHQGGIHPFLRGMYSTVVRDTVWGGTYAALLHLFQTDDAKFSLLLSFGTSTVAAMVATVVSAPFNYARNRCFSTPMETRSPSLMTSLQFFFMSVRESPQPYRFAQQQLGLGWGTLRVGVGMAISSELYSFYRKALDEK